MPNITIYLGHLFVYDDSTQTYINNLINVRKLRGLYTQISKIESFRSPKFNFAIIDQVQAGFNKMQEVDENALMTKSFKSSTN